MRVPTQSPSIKYLCIHGNMQFVSTIAVCRPFRAIASLTNTCCRQCHMRNLPPSTCPLGIDNCTRIGLHFSRYTSDRGDKSSVRRQLHAMTGYWESCVTIIIYFWFTSQMLWGYESVLINTESITITGRRVSMRYHLSSVPIRILDQQPANKYPR